MTLEQIAQQIKDQQIARAKYITENASNFAPFGQRSAALQYFDAKLYLATVADIQNRGLKTTAEERLAIYEGVKQTNTERNLILQAQLKANEGLAILDADIEYSQRIFKALAE